MFDPGEVSYEALLRVFWEGHDPTQGMRQGNDMGTQYRSGIYTSDPEERRLAEESLERVRARFDLPIHTELGPASDFWAAEDYHQDYYRKNPARYAMYRRGCGRDARLEQLWGDEASH